MNLVDLIKGQLTGGVVDQVGAAIGESPAKTQTALGAAIPAILSGLLKVSSTGDGARKLKSAVDQFDAPSMGDLGGLLSGDKSGLIQKGLGLISSLFGNNMLGSAIGALSKFSGIGTGAAKSLMGLALPMILGAIAGKAKGLDAQGLASMLSDQRRNIEDAMPSGFSLADAPAAAAVKREVAPPVAEGLPKWLLPLLGLAALAALAYFLWPKTEPTTDVPAQNTPPPAVVPPRADTPVVPDVAVPDATQLGADYTKAIEGLTTTLGTITDVPTAEAALPALRDADTKLTGLKALFDKIPEAARGPINTAMTSGLDKLKELVAKVLAIPGVGEKIKPVVDAIMGKLGA